MRLQLFPADVHAIMMRPRPLLYPNAPPAHIQDWILFGQIEKEPTAAKQKQEQKENVNMYVHIIKKYYS
jgi:hypothetical protein